MDYEYRALTVPSEASRDATRQILSIHAEYGDWELSGHRIYGNGRRSITVRRRVRGEPLPPLPT